MKTFSKGRKTPINDFSDLSFVKPCKVYERQSREKILAATNFTELDDDLILNRQEYEIQQILKYSNCPTTADLFTLLIYEFYKDNLKKLSFKQRLKWRFEHDIKSYTRRLKNDNDFGLDYMFLLNNYIQTKRFAIRKEPLLSEDEFDESDITVFLNEEHWLHFDALKLSQLIFTDEYERPSCISELICMLIKDKYREIGINIQSNTAMTTKSLRLDFAPFLNKYARLINENTDEKRSRVEFFRYINYLKLNHDEKKEYSKNRFLPRLKEVLL